MHAVKKKLYSLVLRGIQEAQSVARQTIVRHDFSGYSPGVFVKETRCATCVFGGSDVYGATLKRGGASSWVGGSDSGLRKSGMECSLMLEGLRIGGRRHMGITTRPGDRAAEHGVRNPLPKADGSPERIEDQRQDEFLQESKRAAASKVKGLEETVGLPGGISFEAADAETQNELGMSSERIVHETEIEFIDRSQSHSTGAQAGAEVHSDGNLSHGIDEEVHRGLIADSEHPAGRVPAKDDPLFPSADDQEGVITEALSDGGASVAEADTDRTDKVHLYSPDKLDSTDEALDKGQKQWEEGKSVESGAVKLEAEDHERSSGVYGSFKSPL